ncbi:hypothetical protein ACIOYT_00640 [Streptomyces halstedii]|uniref:hypothetical protein n=1 Tax=Streptomyces halstedii TaxID=1944 RepID=UPI0037F70773
MTTQPDRSRTARFLDAVTHSGPGYDTTPNATASNTTSRLHHLLDRMQRGVLLPEEAEQLAGLVGELEKAEARVRELEAAAPTRAALRARYTAAIVDAYPDLRYVADDLADHLTRTHDEQPTT